MSLDTAPVGPRTLPAVICFGRSEIRRETREVLLDGRPLSVRRRVFDLIEYLLLHRPRTVSHSELLQALWQREEASPSLLARAVMEARRAVGDTADEARFIVSVHGVGYRFAGALSTATDNPVERVTDDGVSAQVVELRRRIAQARQAVVDRRFDEAQLIAEDVLQRADAAGSHAEMARAMMVCCQVAMSHERAPDAARLAQRALRMAQAEGFGPLIAEAHLAVGAVHLTVGDPEIAIQQFRAALEGLSAPGLEADLQRCLTWLARGLQLQGDPHAALQVCRKGVALGDGRGNLAYTLIHRVNEVQYLAVIGDRAAERGDRDSAQAAFQEALATSNALLADLDGTNHVARRVSAMGAHAMLLERLDRLDEAWAATLAHEHYAHQMQALGHERTPELRLDASLQRARLLARRGEVTPALEITRAVLAEAELFGKPGWLVGHYAMAADVAARTGRFEQALQWQRAHAQALSRMHVGRAASLAAVLAAELNVDELQTELQRLRTQVSQLATDNDLLRRRLERASWSAPVSAETGLAPATALDTIFAPALEQARSRHLPMCIAVLTLDNAAGLARHHTANVMQSLWRGVAQRLGEIGDVANPAVDLGGGRIAFHVRNAGRDRAQAVADELVALLTRRTPTELPLAQAPRWRCVAADAAAHTTIEDWLLSTMSQPDTSKPQCLNA